MHDLLMKAGGIGDICMTQAEVFATKHVKERMLDKGG